MTSTPASSASYQVYHVCLSVEEIMAFSLRTALEMLFLRGTSTAEISVCSGSSESRIGPLDQREKGCRKFSKVWITVHCA